MPFMEQRPRVDVNLFVFNGASTVGAAIESVLKQTWSNFQLTLIDDGSTDATKEILGTYARHHANVRFRDSRENSGAVAAFQLAFSLGRSAFVLPKSADDLLAPDFIEKTMDVLLSRSDCVMCHAAGLVFSGHSEIRAIYPRAHCLEAIGPDPVERSRHVMARYTSSPSFWGIYRRDAVDRLARIRHRAGWDHALLAELALYGEIRHVAEPLYWRRDGGKAVLRLARAATERGSRGLDVDDLVTEPHWRMPLTTTALAHLETFAAAHVGPAEREALWRAVLEIFRARWLPAMHREATALLAAIPALLTDAGKGSILRRSWILRNLADLLHVTVMLLPEVDVSAAFRAIAAVRSAGVKLEGDAA